MKKKDMGKKDIELNMPNTLGSIFYVLFDDETWTWTGLARMLVKRFADEDMDELINCINVARKKKGD